MQIVFEGTVLGGRAPRVVEEGGTSDDAAWVALADLDTLRLRPNVKAALAARERRS